MQKPTIDSLPTLAGVRGVAAEVDAIPEIPIKSVVRSISLGHCAGIGLYAPHALAVTQSLGRREQPDARCTMLLANAAGALARCVQRTISAHIAYPTLI